MAFLSNCSPSIVLRSFPPPDFDHLRGGENLRTRLINFPPEPELEPLQFVVVLVELPTPVRVSSMAPPAWYIHMLKSKYLLHIKAASCFIQCLHMQLHRVRSYAQIHKKQLHCVPAATRMPIIFTQVCSCLEKEEISWPFILALVGKCNSL